ncbi:MAG: class I SAM-dependent RNA methyltransferase [Pseudomonadota bacterium]
MAETRRFFAAIAPGLEAVLAEEIQETLGDRLDGPMEVLPGGVAFRGDWTTLWRAHLRLRCPGRILLRLGEARVTHLAQLEKWAARGIDWSCLPRAAPGDNLTLRVEASCRKSKLYHSGAVAERIERAAREALGAAVHTDPTEPADLLLLARIERDHCVLSADASGAPLHKRGSRQAIGKAPLRETLATAFLRLCGFDGRETVLDPLCGSGTFVLEAAERIAGLDAGRDRAFAYQRWPSFDPSAFAALRAAPPAVEDASAATVCFGFDRDAGAVAAATANAARAGLSDGALFRQSSLSDVSPPAGSQPGLVMVNPPYGARIGDRSRLPKLHAALGRVLQARFSGWRVGLVTAAPELARATGLPFERPSAPIRHGGLKVRLYRTARLP